MHLKCNCLIHNGAWVPYSYFGVYHKKTRSNGTRKSSGTYRYYATYCRDGNALRRRIRSGLIKPIPRHEVEKWLIEITERCGSYAAAARTIGVRQSILLSWLGRNRSKPVKVLRAESAAKIVKTLLGLRADTIEPKVAKRGAGRTFKYGCAGCGCSLDMNTPGCDVCTDRANRRAYRVTHPNYKG